MKLFHLFGKKKSERPPRQTGGPLKEELAFFAGLRVEVTAYDGRMLFVAKLLSLRGNEAELHQYSEAAIPLGEEPLPVRIRGYSDLDRKAVYMEGVITPMEHKVWAVSKLKLCRVGNDRAFFRLDTDLDATATMFSGLEMGEKPCRLLNISIGGACVSSAFRYHEGDKFLLKVRLLEDREESAMFAQVVRVTPRGNGRFEYGCRFLELTENIQDGITQNIFAAQRQQRSKAKS